MGFDHENLKVYQLALSFVVAANQLIEDLPRGRAYLADQLRRAALSIVLNIAEGAGKFSSPEKAVFYTTARASATEAAAVLDVVERLKLSAASPLQSSRKDLEIIVRMLTNMIKRFQDG